MAEAVEATVVDEGDAGGPGRRPRPGPPAQEGRLPAARSGVRRRDRRRDDLDPAHTHFVLVPADHGAGLARWVAAVATAVAGGNRSVALAAAGGEPAWEAVAAHVRAGRLVMAVARTGGVADQLAAAAAGRPADGRARALAASGQVFAVDPAQGAAHVADTLRSALSRPDALGPAPQG